MNPRSPGRSIERASERGMTLVETVIALAVLFVIAGGLMGLSVVAMMTTENQGHLATRTTEYAQDKIEQLMSLSFTDATTDTISPDCVFYLVDNDCTTGAAGLAVGGDLDFTAPEVNYVDYLNVRGDPLGGGAEPPADWFYMRVWQIEDVSPADCGATPCLKQITVGCITRFVVGRGIDSGLQPQAFLATLKSRPF